MQTTLQDRLWSEFKIDDLFSVTIGQNIDGNKVDKKNGHIPYVTRKESNNGLDGFIDACQSMLNISYPVITIGNETAEPFVQTCKFFTGTKVNILAPKTVMSKYALLFICNAVRKHKSKYSYSYSANSTRLKKQVILLPIKTDKTPDYEFMEQYMRDLEKEKIASYKELVSNRIEKLSSEAKVIPIKDKKWGEFCLKDLFDFQKGNQTNMTILNSGNTPLVSARKIDNGYKDFINTSKGLFQKNSLSLNNDGDGGAGISYYQPYEAALDSHVTALLPKFSISKHALLFISRSITSQRGKFGHGYSLTNNRLSAFKLMLPINSKDSPDYEYMEQYMKQIERNQLIEYINFTNNK